jgi:hypothetical protein
MPQRKTTIPEKVRKLTDRRAFPVAITVLQIVAAAFFAVDAIEDYLVEAKHGFSLATAIEFFIAVAFSGMGIDAGGRRCCPFCLERVRCRTNCRAERSRYRHRALAIKSDLLEGWS